MKLTFTHRVFWTALEDNFQVCLAEDVFPINRVFETEQVIVEKEHITVHYFWNHR